MHSVAVTQAYQQVAPRLLVIGSGCGTAWSAGGGLRVVAQPARQPVEQQLFGLGIMLRVEARLLNEGAVHELQQAVREIHPAGARYLDDALAHQFAALPRQFGEHHLMQLQVGVNHAVAVGLINGGGQTRVDDADGAERTLLDESEQNRQLLP